MQFVPIVDYQIKATRNAARTFTTLSNGVNEFTDYYLKFS